MASLTAKANVGAGTDALAGERVEAVLDDLRDDPVISGDGFDAIEAALARFIEASNAASALAALQAIEAERQRVVRARRRRDDEAVIALLMH